MARVLINGMSAKSGGGKSVLRNLLGAIQQVGSTHDFIIVAPKLGGYEEFASPNMRILARDDLDSLSGLARFSLMSVHRLLAAERIDVLFNPSDIPIKTRTPQIFLFDWPYAAFPDSPAWQLSSARDRLVRQVKLALFKRGLASVELLLAQSAVMAEQLARHYRFREIAVLPNAVSLENLQPLAHESKRDFALPKGFKFLCLSAYYSHKNIESFLPLAEEIRRTGERLRIVTTFGSDHPAARALSQQIEGRKLGEVWCNLGPVAMADVPALYRQTDALLLPTLLESFSGTYVEAMFHGRPILTSDLPFATGVCRDAALYFDPADWRSMLEQMRRIESDPALRESLSDRGREVLQEMPCWQEVAADLLSHIDRLATTGVKPQLR